MTAVDLRPHSRLGRNLALTALVVLSLLVWFIGPLMAVGDHRPLESVASRSIALAGLLAVAGLIWWIRRQPWRIDLADVSVVLAVVVVSVALVWIGQTELSWRRTQAGLTDLASRLHTQADALTPGDAVDQVLPLLAIVDEARDLASDDPKSAAAVDIARQRLLTDALLPRVLRQVEAVLRSADLPQQLRYLLLKTYLALADGRRADSAVTVITLQVALLTQAPPSLSPDQRQTYAAALNRQLVSMLSIDGGEPVALDRVLISQQRTLLSMLPMVDVVGSRIQLVGQSFPGTAWTVAAAAGPQAALAFTRSSGQPITAPSVPVLYTPAGFERLNNDIGRIVADVVADDLVVMGSVSRSADLSGQDLVREALGHYQQAYIAAWQEALNELRLVGGTGSGNQPLAAAAVVRLLRLLSAADSPLLALVRSAAKATTTTPAGRIDAAFGALQHWVATPAGGVAPISHTLAALNTLQLALEAADAARSRGQRPDAEAARARQAMAAAQPIPAPFDTLVGDLMHSALAQITRAP